MYGNLKRFVSIVITIAVIMTMTITPGFADDTPVALSEQDEAAGEELIQEEIETYTYSQETGEDEEGYNDELFARYVEEHFFPELGGYSNNNTMLRSIYLSEINQIIYSRLKSQIEEVAAGNSTSTVFTVSVEELGLTNESWTAEDLNISQIAVNGQVTLEAINALMDYLEIDTGRVLDALLAQCPYELYWYDKTAGVEIESPGYEIRGSRVQTLNLLDGFTFRFNVAIDYAGGQYKTNTYKIGRVMAAIDVAQEIVSEAADFSDYDKLVYYKDRICNEVSYNYEATNLSYDYGDPWQLISVFDRDETTNVVCEGYSKAFKYLCDQSTFEEEGLECIIVSGTMAGATGAGNHMWNIVTTERGNFLVDVTNCDEGSIGAPDQLFMAGSETGSPQDGYTFSLPGGDVYYSYDKTAFETYDYELELSPTKYEGAVEYVTEDGIRYSVLNGKAVFMGFVELSSDHVIVPEEIEGYPVASIGRGAFYGLYTLTDIYIPSCVTSIGVEAFALTELANVYYQGTYDEWENVSKGYDAIPEYANVLCEADLVDGHIYIDDVGVTAEPTCTEEGEGVRECRICGELQTVKVPALGHDLIHHDGSEGTCTEGGWTEYDTCSRCDYTTYTATEPKGHTPEVVEAVEPTCTEDGLTEGSRCAVCGETLTMQLIVNALGHDFHVVEGSAVEPTCTTDGKEADQVCSRCGELQEGTYLQASGHTVIDLYAEEPTCTEPGLTAGKKCYFCGEILEAQEEIPATGHSWGEWIVVKEATADEDGLMRRVCANDANHIEEEVIPKTGGVDPGDESILDTIEITNINTEIIPGEKAEFTAKLLSDNMSIVNERWFRTDQMKILTGGSDDLPEVGEEYIYFITVGANEGYTFADDLTVKYNGEVVDADIHVDNETDISITGIIPNVTVTEQEVEEPEEMAVDFYDTTGNLTWYWVPEYGPTTYELRITNAGSSLPETPCATKYIESGSGPFYFMIYQEINNLLNNGTITKSEAYRVSLSAVNQQGKVFQKWEKSNLKIPKKEFTDDTVSLDKTVYPYTGNNVNIKVYYRDTLLGAGDHSLNYSGRPKDIGDYTVTITAYEGSEYTGSVTKAFKIKGDLAGKSIVPTVTLDPEEEYVYTGEPVEPTVTSVTFAGLTLTEGQDYTVSYADNNAAGTGYVIISAVEDSYYMGEKQIPFTITEETPKNGWIQEGSDWYYYENGTAATGWKKISKKWYYMDAEGVMQTGWQKISGKWYYFNSSGAMQTGWVKISNKWYYFDSSGVMQTGWQKISGKQYFFKPSGAMAANEWVKGYYWINKDGTWTYKYKASWKKSGSKWWFGDTSGWYAKNTTITIDGKKYTFDAKGYMK